MDNPTECASPPIPPNKIACPRFTFMEEDRSEKEFLSLSKRTGESAVSIHPTLTTTTCGAWSEQVTGENRENITNRSPVQAGRRRSTSCELMVRLTAEDRLPPVRSQCAG